MAYEAELRCPPLPAALAYLWKAYARLRRRSGGGFGVAPIAWVDIDAFCRRAHPLSAWDVELIEMLDDLYLAEQAKSQGTSDS